MMLTPDAAARKRNFKAALAYAGVTIQQFCEAADVGKTQLYAVLNGERPSATLTAKIDAFILEHTPALPERAAV